MAGISDTLSMLRRTRLSWPGWLRRASPQAEAKRAAPPPKLAAVADFGTNPGNLRMFVHVPASCGANPALVVVLHGCGQGAADFDAGTGWSRLADLHGFIILAPEQDRANNSSRCFNWFVEEDMTRNHGEAASIRQMVENLKLSHDIDPKRIFVTGLSAGGAMANIMLAAYPETFAGGAILAGLPYGSATSVRQALKVMSQGQPADPWERGDLVRKASSHHGAWPRVLVIHGEADTIVSPANADDIASQWRDVHALGDAPARDEARGAVRRRSWGESGNLAAVEMLTVKDMAHGAPVDGGKAREGGEASSFFPDAGFDSTRHIASFFGLLPESAWPLELARRFEILPIHYVPSFMRRN